MRWMRLAAPCRCLTAVRSLRRVLGPLQAGVGDDPKKRAVAGEAMTRGTGGWRGTTSNCQWRCD
jgi:hypothetical protein